MAAVPVPRSSTPSPVIANTIHAALAAVDGRVQRVGPTAWRVTPARLRHGQVSIRVADMWLEVTRALRPMRAMPLRHAARWSWRVLNDERAWPAGVRPAVRGDDLRVQLRGEQPVLWRAIEDPTALAHWLQAGIASCATFKANALDTVPSAPHAQRAPSAEVRALVSEAGWSITPRENNDALVVELPARQQRIAHATVSERGDELDVRTVLRPGDGVALDRSSQTAVALALLRVAGAVRWVRATATHGEDGIRAVLEVRVPRPFSAVVVHHALSALAVGCEQVADELDALARDPALARAYLSLQGVR